MVAQPSQPHYMTVEDWRKYEITDVPEILSGPKGKV